MNRLLLVLSLATSADAFVPHRLSSSSPRLVHRASAAAPPLAPARLSTRLQSVDDNDEVAKLKEAAEKLRLEVAALEQERDAAAEEARAAAFAAFDKNKDGIVDNEELKLGLSERFGLSATDNQLSELIKEFDENKDGVLQLDEFKIDLIRNRLEGIQRAEKDLEREERRLAMEAERIEKEKESLSENFGPENLDSGVGPRVLSCLPYILPLCDGAQYGRFLLEQVPLLGNVLGPAVFLFRSVPFGGLLAFWFMINQSKNRDLPRIVRFNLQQAVLVDIALFFPSLIGALLSVGSPDLVSALSEPASDAMFVTLLGTIAYICAGNLATGKIGGFPKVPLIGENAERSIGGPFDSE